MRARGAARSAAPTCTTPLPLADPITCGLRPDEPCSSRTTLLARGWVHSLEVAAWTARSTCPPSQRLQARGGGGSAVAGRLHEARSEYWGLAAATDDL